MTVTFDLESIEGVAAAIVHGPLSPGEMQESAAALARVRGPLDRLLWDMREASFDFSTTEIRRLAEFAKGFSEPLSRIAFVASRDLEFALLGMFVVFRGTAETAASVFRLKNKAIEWLMSSRAREVGALERELLDAMRGLRGDLSTLERSSGSSFDSVFADAGLTRREEEVARALIERGGAEELSAYLGVSRHTVRNHQRKIYSKLGVRSESDLLRKFIAAITIAAD